MKSLLAVCLFVVGMLAYQANANALELFSYKDAAAQASYTETQVETLWKGNISVCIKDGSKIVGVNKAFKANKLGYRDCSSSSTAIRKQQLTGVKVIAIKLTELPSKIAKQVLGIKG